MENEKNFVHDLREMVKSRHEEPVAEGTACVVLAKEGGRGDIGRSWKGCSYCHAPYEFRHRQK